MTAGRLGTVFLSHSAREPDHAVTGALAKALTEVGLDVWWDREGLEGGDFFAVEILEAIIRQRFFLFIVSPRSVASRWCLRELVRATELGKETIPLILEPVSEHLVCSTSTCRQGLPTRYPQSFARSVSVHHLRRYPTTPLHATAG